MLAVLVRGLEAVAGEVRRRRRRADAHVRQESVLGHIDLIYYVEISRHETILGHVQETTMSELYVESYS